MPTDTYGYDVNETSSPDDEGRAIAAMWSGVGSIVLFLMGPCMCYVPMLMALPLGMYSIYQGIGVPSSAPASSRHMAWAGMLSGIVGSAFSAFLLLFLAMYFLLILVAIVAGAASGQ